MKKFLEIKYRKLQVYAEKRLLGVSTQSFIWRVKHLCQKGWPEAKITFQKTDLSGCSWDDYGN